MSKAKLYLIPSAIAEKTRDKLLTPQLAEILSTTKYFVVEHARDARRFISSLQLGIRIEELSFEELNKYEPAQNISQLLEPVLQGKNLGLMSDAGCPGVADPGAELVKLAHAKGIEVVPLIGPSSILLALMASGLSGQNFRFTGYLPIDKKELTGKLQELESQSKRYNETEIFIETPYRSDKMFAQLIATLNPTTQLTIAKGITGADEQIITKPVAIWRKQKIIIGKTPTVFLFLAS